MSNLLYNFHRDISYFKQNQIPQTKQGVLIENLYYRGDQYEFLTDDDIKVVTQSLLQNQVFRGILDLQLNQITDFGILNLSELIRKSQGLQNISELDLTGCQLTLKSGIFMGQALIDNPNYQISKIIFKGIKLEEDGLVRMLQAVNANKFVKKLHIGIISDLGLRLLSKFLTENKSLIKLEFQEDAEKIWTQEPKRMFCDTIRNYTVLELIKFETVQEEDQIYEFKHEIDYYTKKNMGKHKKLRKAQKRQEQCNQDVMFDNMLKLIEDKGKHKKMPVRKFLNNTFGTLLNDAIFELKKKQFKEPDNLEIMNKQGMVKFVAFYLLENLPDQEKEPDLYNVQSDHEDH